MPDHLSNSTIASDSSRVADPTDVVHAQGRRTFLKYASTITAAAAFAGTLSGTAAQARDVGPLNPKQRSLRSFQIRTAAAQAELQVPLPPHPTNGDEVRYASRIGSYTKGLPHNELGEVNPAAFNALVYALKTGRPADFESIPLGATADRPLVNPQAALAYDLQGTDSHQLAMLPAPTLAGAEEAGEMVELYWQALLRDVPFTEFEDGTTNSLVLAAVDDLNRLSSFRGPRTGGLVTPQTLFRGNVSYTNYAADRSGRTGAYFTPPGVLTGPYISQFLWLNAPFGVEYVNRQMRTTRAGVDYMTAFDEWLLVQNGGNSGRSQEYESGRRYIINGRDLGQWVHIDVLFQAYFDACLILLGNFDAEDPFSSGVQAPRNPGNPYIGSRTQIGFGTFGGPYFITLVSEVATRALKAVWYQKWAVHRRLRPEAFGGLVYKNLSRGTSYPLHPEIFDSTVLSALQDTYGSAYNVGLLPQAFPEGSPTHPSYGAGHAMVAGACVTILKAMFDENYLLSDPVLPDPSNPTVLIPYEGPPLSVGGELNKLATNIAIGRNTAGVHWRSDAAASLVLGEELAISLLRDQRGTYNENFNGYTFTRFNGSVITV